MNIKLKGSIEKRNDILEKMEVIANKTVDEKRNFTEEENTEYRGLHNEINGLDQAIENYKMLEDNEKRDMIEVKPSGEDEETRKLEENFCKYLAGETRALTATTDGKVLIPTTLSNKIIEKVKEISPLYAMTNIFNVGGNLTFPIESGEMASATYVGELTELTEKTGEFTSITLENHIMGSLSKISKSLINRSDFDLVSYTVRKIAEAFSDKIESELIKGQAKMHGLVTTTNIVTAELSADALIDLQDEIPQKLQHNACFLMSKKTFKDCRKLKDNDGNFLLGNLKEGFGYTILAKSVVTSENCEDNVIFYGDYSGLYVKVAQNIEIEVLREKYATEHALGVLGFMEVDSKIVEVQKIAKLEITPSVWSNQHSEEISENEEPLENESSEEAHTEGIEETIETESVETDNKKEKEKPKPLKKGKGTKGGK